MTDIYLVRHGNTFDKGDVITRVGARTDLPLSSSGMVQAEALGGAFNELVPAGFAKAYCSPLLRTRQTAEAILSASENAPELKTLEFLREIDYGPDENQPEDNVIARLGQSAIEAWDREAVPPPGWNVDPARLKQDWRELIAELGIDVMQQPVLIVTSNGIARFVLDAVTSMDTDLQSIKLKTGAYGLIQAERATVSLTAWNVRP